MTEDMNRFAFNTEGKICDYGEEEPKVLTDQEILEELNRLDQANYELLSENTSVNWTNECLQEQLDKAIVPKFKIGQEVWYVEDKFTMNSGEILEIQIWDLKKDNIVYVIEYGGNVWCESVVFATKEQAEARLKELKNDERR